ncbi:Protein F16F9.4, partial [Aphelenchoides avenae]
MHGGGWCVLRPSHYDGSVYALMRRFETVVVSIDYRLSPETQFPAAVEDCEAVVKAIYEEGYTTLGVDRDRIAVMGDSAGGNLATVVCQRLLRQKRAYIRCQVLINPVTHALDFQSSSYRDYYRSCKDTALLDPSTLAMWYLLYLGIKPTRRNIKSVLQNRHFSKDRLELDDILSSLIDSASTPKKPLSTSQLDKAIEVFPNAELSERFSKLISPDLCPLLGTDLQGLAPALIATMETDIVRDEGILYAKRLKSFGVPTVWRHYERGYHGVIHMPR